MRVIHLTGIILGLTIGLLMALAANHEGQSTGMVFSYGLIGAIGAYAGTWLTVGAALVFLSVASGLALAGVLFFALFCFALVVSAFLQ